MQGIAAAAAYCGAGGDVLGIAAAALAVSVGGIGVNIGAAVLGDHSEESLNYLVLS